MGSCCPLRTVLWLASYRFAVQTTKQARYMCVEVMSKLTEYPLPP